MQLAHLASRLYGTPLLLARSKLDIILAVLGSRIGWPESNAGGIGSTLTPPMLAQSASRQELLAASSGIAVIEVLGSLVRRSVGLEAQSGLLSYAEIAGALEAAAANPSVAGIVLEIDSPGGEAAGVFELAQRIRQIDAIKPVPD